MKRIVCCILLILLAFSSPVDSALSRETLAPQRAGISPNLLYLAGGHLWLHAVDGGPAHLIATPWPMVVKQNVAPGFKWSPDGKRVALDDSGARLAVINLNTGRITILLNRRCPQNCSFPVYAWSPSGRYLALIQPIGSGERGVLRVWDSAVGKTHRLLANLPAYVAYPEWSHDSTRIAVEVGSFDSVKGVYPGAVTVDLAGHIVRLGKGQYLSWSPDDRLIGIIRPNTCGANTCDENEVVERSAGGAPIVLARHASSLFDNPIWASQAHGYAFDRWLLDASGRPTRRLAGPRERVLSWKPDGSLLALQTYYPYQSTRDVLFLSTPAGKRIRFYADTLKSSDCGACSKDVYGITWGRGDQFAFSSRTYPTPSNVVVYPKYFVSSTSGGPLARIAIPGRDNVDVFGFVAADQSIIIRAGRSIVRYEVATHRLSTIVTGVAAGYNTALLQPPIPGI